MSKQFILSEWLMAGIIDGYKTRALPFCETTDRVAKYLSKNLISTEEAIEVGMACPKPEEVIEEDIIEETEAPIEEETVIEETEQTETTEPESGGESRE